MSDVPVSKLADHDMQAVPAALMRAARAAREVARSTGTSIVIVRDGILIEESVDDSSEAVPGLERPSE